MKFKGPISFFIFMMALIYNPSMSQDLVDVGIFESSIEDVLVVKARPNFNLNSPYYITSIIFTIKWPVSSSVTQLNNIVSPVNSLFNLQVQQSTIYNGYRYQVYAMVGQKFVNWSTGGEYPILEVMVNYPGGDCTTFEISNDTYTQQVLNGRYYFEVVASDYTGILYQPAVSMITYGGVVTSDETICLGSSTSVMTLSGYSGTVETWQMNFNGTSWTDISGTAGLVEYTATPENAGTYQYRARVQRGTCGVEFSLPANIAVAGYSSWNGNADTLWNNPGNWNVCGVPNLSKNVEIPVVLNGHYPSVATASQCMSLIIRPGATVRILLTGSLTVGSSTYQPLYPEDQTQVDNNNPGMSH